MYSTYQWPSSSYDSPACFSGSIVSFEGVSVFFNFNLLNFSISAIACSSDMVAEEAKSGLHGSCCQGFNRVLNEHSLQNQSLLRQKWSLDPLHLFSFPSSKQLKVFWLIFCVYFFFYFLIIKQLLNFPFTSHLEVKDLTFSHLYLTTHVPILSFSQTSSIMLSFRSLCVKISSICKVMIKFQISVQYFYPYN